MYFYKASSDDITIKYLKILQNLLTIRPFIEKLKKKSQKIILYGSAAKGENLTESDIDLFIMSRLPDEVEKLMYKSKLREKIQCVVNTPTNYVKMKKNNPAFYSEVEKGILLWEAR